MKILFVTSSFRGGGITSYAHEAVKSFAEDNEVSVVIGSDEKNPFDRKRVKVYECEVADTSIANARHLLSLINDEVCPDVIVNSNALLMSLLTPYVNDDIRCVSISHSLRYNEADVAGLNAAYLDTLIALSNYGGKYLADHYRIKDHQKIKVVYNFVNTQQNASAAIAKKKQTKVLRIVFAGGTSAAKSPELVFDILSLLQKTDLSFEFYFMGYNSPTLQSIQRYKSIQELLPEDSRIHFTGKIPRYEAEELIGSANIFLVPSRREGCPMAMLEALSMGAIPITSDYKNACREMVEDGKNGFIINHKDVNGFVKRIEDIILHHDRYLAMYDASYQNFIKHYSYEPWRRQMLDIIKSPQALHEKRFTEFDESRYQSDLKRIKRRNRYNKYHMLLFETLKSAIPFYIKHLKHKL